MSNTDQTDTPEDDAYFHKHVEHEFDNMHEFLDAIRDKISGHPIGRDKLAYIIPLKSYLYAVWQDACRNGCTNPIQMDASVLVRNPAAHFGQN